MGGWPGRQPAVFAFPPLTPIVKRLLIGLLGCYVAELVLQNFVGVPVYGLLALSPSTPGVSTLWQLVTYVVVWPPRAVLQVLISLVFIWLVLSPFEARFGPRRTIQLCVVSVLAASVPALAIGLVLPQGTALSGATPILVGSIAAFAWTLRGRGQLMLFGVFPMQAIHIIWLLVGVTLLFFLASRNWLNLVAELGAIGAGIGFVEWMSRPPGRGKQGRARSVRRRSAPFSVIDGGGDDGGPRWYN